MRVLIFGAGVHGSYYGWKLSARGVDVTLFAREERRELLLTGGIFFYDAIKKREQNWTPHRVISSPEGDFDLIIVFLQAQQVPSALEVLKSFPDNSLIAFMGNGITSAEEGARLLGKHRVLTGFGGIGGYRRGNCIYYADRRAPDKPELNQLVLGAPFRESRRGLEKVVPFLEDQGFRVSVFHPIKDWHLCHAMIVVNLYNMLRSKNFDCHAVAADRRTIARGLKVFRIMLRTLKREGYHILPDKMTKLLWMPSGLIRKKITTAMDSLFAEIALASHAGKATEEMDFLHNEINRLLFSEKRPPKVWMKMASGVH